LPPHSSAGVLGAWDPDLSEWTADALHDPVALALLGFRIEDGSVVAQDGPVGGRYRVRL